MPKYRVSIAKRPDGGADAWVVDLPGCRAAAGSLKDALALLPVVVGDHLAWLAGHGEPVSPDAAFEFEVADEADFAGDVTFESDRTPLSREELNRAIDHAGYAHADLLERLAKLPDVVLDWVPPASAVKIDQIFPDVRSMRDMLEHLNGVEANFYVGSLSDEPVTVTPPMLSELHELTAKRLHALPEESLGRVFKRTTPRGEMEWTARKAVRRIINHKRFHTREIEQRLSWLTLGVPEILPQNRE
jgi:predicted RNase H-like HicB family nuclease